MDCDWRLDRQHRQHHVTEGASAGMPGAKGGAEAANRSGKGSGRATDVGRLGMLGRVKLRNAISGKSSGWEYEYATADSSAGCFKQAFTANVRLQ